MANALMTQSRQLNRIISPAAAGALIGWLGEHVCFFIDGFTFIGSALLLSTIVLRRAPSARGLDFESLRGDFTEGMKFVWNHRRIRFVILSMSVMILAAAAVDVLSPIYVRDLLGGEARLLGLLMSCVASGTIIGTLLIGRYGRSLDNLQLVSGGITGIGAGVLMLAAFRDIRALGAGLGVGLAVALVTVPSQTLIQEETPQDRLGRTTSLLNVTSTVSQRASVGMAGIIADVIGIQTLYYSAGLF